MEQGDEAGMARGKGVGGKGTDRDKGCIKKNKKTYSSFLFTCATVPQLVEDKAKFDLRDKQVGINCELINVNQ